MFGVPIYDNVTFFEKLKPVFKSKFENQVHLEMKFFSCDPSSFQSMEELIDHVPSYLAHVYRIWICVVYFSVLAFGIVLPAFLDFLYSGISMNFTESTFKLICFLL